MTPLGTVLFELRQSINEIANPENSTEDKMEAVESALREICEVFEHLRDCFEQLSR